jgi:uncharacterized protein YndB with AHSA1/START domain
MSVSATIEAVPRVRATAELLAPREDVWAFLAEPHHLPDWWPGIGGVEPDRRGLAAGARWQVRGAGRPTLFRKPYATQALLVRSAARPELVAWHLTGQRLDVELRLEATTLDRTRATLTLEGPPVFSARRSLARTALERLRALCQTAAAM